jgi:hypothetical protein
LKFYEECYELRLKIFGENHEKTIDTAENYARLLFSKKEFTKTVELFYKVLHFKE